MKIFNTVKVKLTLPPFAMFLIIVVLAVVVGSGFFKTAITNRVESSLKSENERFQHEIKNNIKDISSIAHLFSSMQTVVGNFSICQISQDTINTDELFSKELLELSSDFDYNIDFYLPDGKMVYTNHDNATISNDELVFLKNVANSQRAYNGFANFNNEKKILSIYPVISSRKTIGIVVISKEIKELAKAFFLPENVGLVMLDENKREIYKTSTDINIAQLNQVVLENKNAFFDVGNYKIKAEEIYTKNKSVFATVYIYFDMSDELGFVKDLLFYLILFSLFAFVVGGLIYSWGINTTIVKPIKLINKKILILSRGELTDKINKKPNDEFGQIISSVNILIDNQGSTAEFAKKVGVGELDVEYQALGKNDQIGNALIEMKDKLVIAKKDEEQRKAEDDKRNWAINGFAKFGDILRQSSDNIEEFSINIISNLVKYTNSNQGGIFIYNDDDENNITLDLVAMYAYNREKYAEASIKLGEGLIGTCAIEKQTINITDIPNDYISITSGLGEATPRNILLVPLKIEEKVFGVIEIASFNKYEAYMIEFIEKLGESIAQSINSTRINIRTNELLEQSQQQQEEMKAQEEELRQNMEEMLATQEEANRKEFEVKGVLDAINSSALVAMFDTDWNVISVNENFEKLFGIPKEQMIGMNHSNFSDSLTKNTSLKNDIENGKIVKLTTKLSLPNGKTIWLKELYSPIKDANEDIIKIINISTDITQEKELEEKLKDKKA